MNIIDKIIDGGDGWHIGNTASQSKSIFDKWGHCICAFYCDEYNSEIMVKAPEMYKLLIESIGEGNVLSIETSTKISKLISELNKGL